MCGVFGYVSKDGERVNLDVLRRIAAVTERRGPHAWGMAWLDGKGRMHMYKQTGRVTDCLPMLAMARDARLLIGHCRWATHGTAGNNLNNHPHPSDGGWIVHNGQILDHEEIAIEHNLHQVSECDSEVLGLLVAQGTGKLIDRVTDAVDTVRARPLVMLGIWKPGHLVAARNGNPLHVGDLKGNKYLASLPDGLPGPVKSYRDGQVIEYRLKGYVNAVRAKA